MDRGPQPPLVAIPISHTNCIRSLTGNTSCSSRTMAANCLVLAPGRCYSPLTDTFYITRQPLFLLVLGSFLRKDWASGQERGDIFISKWEMASPSWPFLSFFSLLFCRWSPAKLRVNYFHPYHGCIVLAFTLGHSSLFWGPAPSSLPSEKRETILLEGGEEEKAGKRQIVIIY